MHKACVEIYRIEWLDLLVKCGINSDVVTYLVLLLPSSVRVKVCHCFVFSFYFIYQMVEYGFWCICCINLAM